jgi:hypothetical protein
MINDSFSVARILVEEPITPLLIECIVLQINFTKVQISYTIFIWRRYPFTSIPYFLILSKNQFVVRGCVYSPVQ